MQFFHHNTTFPKNVFEKTETYKQISEKRAVLLTFHFRNKKNRIKIIQFLKSSFSQCLNLMTLMLLIKQIVLIIAM